MFDRMFDGSMLDNLTAYGNGLIIHCPTKELFDKLMQIAHERNIRWASGACAFDEDVYDRYGEQTCCYISPGYGMRYGSKESAIDGHEGYVRCTISETSDIPFEAENDDALNALFE